MWQWANDVPWSPLEGAENSLRVCLRHVCNSGVGSNCGLWVGGRRSKCIGLGSAPYILWVLHYNYDCIVFMAKLLEGGGSPPVPTPLCDEAVRRDMGLETGTGLRLYKLASMLMERYPKQLINQESLEG